MKRSRFSEEQIIGREDECGRRLGKNGGGLSGAGTIEIELISEEPLEPGVYEDPQNANAEHHGGAMNFGNDAKLYHNS